MGENSNPIISVVIPAFNRENLIKKCIESVLGQTYSNIEVIVVDDCSSDNTVEAAKSISDSRIRVIKLERNSGACYARNYGADLSKGKYIAFQDSDDMWYPDKLEKQLKYMESGDYDLVFCGMNRQREASGPQWYVPRYKLDVNADIYKQILKENCISTQCILVKKEMFDKIRFDESIKRYQDWDFAIRASKIAKIGYQEEAMAYSPVQDNSISNNVSTYHSLNVLYNKYRDDIIGDKDIHVEFLKRMGNALQKTDSKKAASYYTECLKVKFNFKMLVKMILCKLKKENA